MPNIADLSLLPRFSEYLQQKFNNEEISLNSMKSYFSDKFQQQKISKLMFDFEGDKNVLLIKKYSEALKNKDQKTFSQENSVLKTKSIKDDVNSVFDDTNYELNPKKTEVWDAYEKVKSKLNLNINIHSPLENEEVNLFFLSSCIFNFISEFVINFSYFISSIYFLEYLLYILFILNAIRKLYKIYSLIMLLKNKLYIPKYITNAVNNFNWNICCLWIYSIILCLFSYFIILPIFYTINYFSISDILSELNLFSILLLTIKKEIKKDCKLYSIKNLNRQFSNSNILLAEESNSKKSQDKELESISDSEFQITERPKKRLNFLTK